MSNYINVLRRLERERRSPEPVQTPIATPVLPAETTVQTAAPAIAPPAVVPITPPLPEAAPMPTPRTVIPLPNVALPSIAPVPAPVVAAPVAPAPRAETPVLAPAPPLASPSLDTRRARAFAADPHPGIATLLDNIRMLSGQRAGRIVVLCGASTAEPVGPLAADLAAHAGERGMRAILGTLVRTPAGTLVMPGQGALDETASVRVDLDAGASPEDLHAWAQHIAPGNDLVVLTGPPLATSIDAALLACACDGLVIVAESEVTDRAALHTAAERARIAGCRTLGVVMHGTKDRMPGWIRRMLGEPAETPVRED